MKILFAASECMPFVKTGGLADVVGALPRHLLAAGEDVRALMDAQMDAFLKAGESR